MRPATVVIGTLGRPHGVRGALHARPSGPTLATLAPGEAVEARPREGAPRTLVLAGRSGMDRAPILEFEGVGSREDASALTGAVIAVDAARVPETDDPDTFYVHELVGCEVLLGTRPLGTVREVFSGPANDALEVDAEGGPVLVPFHADAVVELDVPGRRIVLREDLFGADGP
ncbi:MAG: ribosome maturation factor RimM [Thermoleophilia bacterium]